jgi:WD40 repeat protein
MNRLPHASGADSHLVGLASDQWMELECIVDRFESAWRLHGAPDVAEYLPLHGHFRLAVLCELVATDLEWRWRSGMTATAQDYLSRFPELNGDHQAIVHLATSEFIARRRAGCEVDPAELLHRFPRVAEQLREALAEAATHSLATPTHRETPCAGGDFDTGAPPTDRPRRIGRYELQRAIGSGSFGTVYEAIDSELGRRVAVKLPRHEANQRSEERTRFVREAHNLARLSHPAIVPVLDVGWSEGLFYIVCSLVDGPTLAERLANGPLAPRAAAEFIATIALALEHAHQHGIVHRDVKPSNILFDARGSPWLTDFGLAMCRDGGATLTTEGQLLGTPAYMAPEQAAGAAHRVDGRSDVYSLGVILYECLTGQLPFIGSPSAVLDQIRYCEPMPPRRIDARIDRDLEVICLAALEKHPADRYHTAAALALDLRRYLAGEPIRARPPGPARRLVKWARRRPAAAALSAMALLAMVTVTSVIWWHNVQLRAALVETVEARRQAEILQRSSQQSQRQTENLLYAADIRLATNAYLNGDRLETLRRLRRYVPAAGTPDRREFAWRRLWSLCHADQQTLTGHLGDVYAAQVVSGGRQLVSAGRDGTLRLWDLANDTRPKILAQSPDELGFAALSQDGMTLATAGDDGIIRIWDLAAQRETRQFTGHANWVLCGAISPQGDQLATAGRDNVIRLWALPRGELVAELAGHTSAVESLAYLPDGHALASTGSDCTLRLWDVAAKSGSVLATHPLPAHCVACSHDGRSLATGCVDYHIYVWDVATRSLRGRLSGHTEIVQSVAFSPDDMRLASASRDGTVRVWDAANLTQVESFMSHSARVWNVAWLPDGATLASAGGDGTVRLWRCGTSRLERAVSIPTEVNRVYFSCNDGRVWLTAKKQAVWALDADGPLTRLATPSGNLRHLALARNADVLAVATDGRHVCLYNGSGQPLSSAIELPTQVERVALSPAGDLLAVSSPEGELYLHELPTFRLRWSRAVQSPGAPSVEFTPQGDKLLVAGAESFVAIYDVADGAVRISLKARQCLRVAISPNGKMLAAGCSDRAIRIWDSEKGIEQTCLQGHDGAVESLGFSPDGLTLAAGTSAGSVTLWHVPSWQELGSFQTSLAVINDLVFSPEGNNLVLGGRTAAGSGQVVFWETKAVDD